MAQHLGVKILTSEEIDFFKDRVERVLAEKGVFVENHQEGLELLKKAGAEVSPSDGRVKFPRKLIDDSLKVTPREFTLAAIDPKYDLPLPHPQGLFYTRTNTGGMYYVSETFKREHITLEEVAEWTKLANALEHIDFWSLPSTKPVDFPAETIDIHTFDTVLRNTTKHGWLQPYELKNVQYLIEMAGVFVGGKEKLRQRPIVSLISCSASPLTFKPMDIEIILQGARYGIPLQPCSLPTAGANAPITPQGIALMASAEVLAQIVMAQLFAPGTPCVATPLLFEMDMMTTNASQSTMSTTMGRMATMQLFEEGYGIPAHTYATGTDSFLLDAQAGLEASSLAHMVMLSGASVLGGAGQIETAKAINPQQLIIDNDLFGMVKQLKTGLVVNDETLAFNEVMNLTGRESFVSLNHTFRHFRDGYRAKTVTHASRSNWEAKGSKDAVARATDIYFAIKEKYELVTLAPEVAEELDAVVKRADKALSGKA
jgi:trimethylamine--corrinoid protein Co-methyltransferase